MKAVQPFLIPPQLDVTELLAKAGELFTVEENGEQAVDALYYDTFDWRLFMAGLTLLRQGSRYVLAERQGAELAVSGAAGRKKKLFWWDFPEGELSGRLKPLIEERALLPQAAMSGNHHRFNLCNDDAKTVLRLVFCDTICKKGDQQVVLPSMLVLEPLKGYGKAVKQVCRLLAAEGGSEIAGGYDPVAMAQAAYHIDPKDTDSTFAVELDRQETVGQAVRDICLHLRSTMLLNVDGTLEDIDSEFLHDFRVSVRRTRSLLSLMKKQLPAEETKRFQAEFKWLGSVTGPVRDLDVYLLKEQEYRDLLPEELQDGLAFFFAELARRRKRELKKLRVHLRSSRFGELLRNWEILLHELPNLTDYPEGQRQCRTVTGLIIKKRLERILRDGRSITPSTPDKKLHELRIEGKKFRYLLEFFRTLFDREAVDAYLKQMKKLQNVLGDFNDLTVQRGMLAHHLQQLDPGEDQSLTTAAALGGLIVHLYEEQRLVRGRFEETFAAFAADENVALAEKILHDPEDGPPLEG